jgi:formate hydrogenlyase transcriptional activator
LFYRLHVFPIVIPPLRERPKDIPLLARHFLEHFRSKLKRQHLGFSAQSMDRLVQYTWPGNVRELQNVIERAVILARSSTIEIDDQFLAPRSSLAEPDTTDNLQELERQHIIQILNRTQWRIYGPNGAAAQLGLNPSTLRSRLKKLGLKHSTVSPTN